MKNRPKQRIFQDDEDSDTDQEPLYTISDENSWFRHHYLEFLNSFYRG